MFSLNDVMGKWLVATYSVGQVLLIRSAAALLVLAPILWREKPRDLFRPDRPRLHILRVGAAMAEVACFYWAVGYLPLADTMTFYLAGPVYVTAAAAFFLGERVSWRGWMAVLAAFVGVVIALRPSAATLTAPALVAIAGSALYALYLLCTRSLRGASNLTLTAWSFVGALLLGLVWAPFAWVTPTLLDFLLIGLLGAVALCAHVCVNHSLKLAPASVVVPYQYTMLLWAIIFGYVVFGDVPAFWMLVGAGIIVLSGLFLFLNEQRGARPGKA
jgi:drug/metabolite transporter (DMT)-like permease